MDWIKSTDYALFKDVNLNLHSPILDPIFAAFSYSGLGVTLVIVFLLMLFSKRTRWLVLPLFATLILGGLVLADGILKPLLARDRPSNLYFAHPEEPIYFSSFPSGHSCVAFGTAFTVLFLTWKTAERPYGWGLLIWACLVGFSRIYRGVHWPTDVISGALLGLFSACTVVLVYNRLESKQILRPSRRTGSNRGT